MYESTMYDKSDILGTGFFPGGLLWPGLTVVPSIIKLADARLTTPHKKVHVIKRFMIDPQFFVCSVQGEAHFLTISNCEFTRTLGAV